eukprot:TRINITY_DN619_c0_g2_i1.p1 TRINITY_DN619_c0_g2~~TRINITY_DN619_c0_g2_i1.p1  ORF type:complete len:1061 (+),score=393.50 TRINITY_DN619_c0_g2_i1:107-3289(+)
MASPELEIPSIDVQSGRSYKHATLKNGLQVLVISDPNTSRGAASMDCKVGKINDPDEVPGLAHFCEHMMFLGTEKYPHEGAYESYVTRSGGRLNAFTSMENTCYSFEVGVSMLDGALDRFAQFFIAPLFTESATGRELMAVESEYQRARTQEGFHFATSFLKQLVRPEHPYSRFAAGNKQTLLDTPREKGINVRDFLIRFQKQHYTVQNLRLCVYGKDDCDTLLGMVREKYEAISNTSDQSNHGHAPWKTADLFKEDASRKIYFVRTVAEEANLSVIWECPFSYSVYRTKPWGAVSHLLGHECEGTIIYELKRRHWANALVSGPMLELGADKLLFQIGVYLTDEGTKHIREIVHMIFVYIAIIKEEGISDEVFQEVRGQSLAEFHYSEMMRNPFSHTQECAVAMNRFPPEHILSGDTVVFERSEEQTNQFINILKPDNAVICVKRSEFAPDSVPVAFDRDTPFIEKQYGAWDVPQDWLEQWQQATPTQAAGYHLRLPDINRFMPDSFDIHKSAEDELPDPYHPIKLFDRSRNTQWEKVSESEIEAWFWKDNHYNVPKSYLMMTFASPVASLSVRHRVLTRLYVHLIFELNATASYFADIANLHLSIQCMATGIRFHMGGLDQKLPVLLETILRRTNELWELNDEEAAIFETRRQCFVQELRTHRTKQPVTHGQDTIQIATRSPCYPAPEQLEVALSLTREDMSRFIREFRSQLRLVLFVGGNLTKNRVQSLITSIPEWFDVSKSFFPSTHFPSFGRVHQIPAGKNYIIPSLSPNPTGNNSLAMCHIQLGSITAFNRACAGVFESLIEHIFYHTLRTTEQLGYAVWSAVRYTEVSVSFEFVVQSALCDPWYAYSRIHCFISALDTWIDTLTEEDFNKVLQSTIEKKRDKPKTLFDQLERWWRHIETRSFEFDRLEATISALEVLTLDQLREFYREKISLASDKRASITSFIYNTSPEQKAEYEGLVARWKGLESQGATPIALKEPRKLAQKVDLVKSSGNSATVAKADEATATEAEKEDHLLNIKVADLDDVEVDVAYIMRSGELKMHLATYPQPFHEANL